MSKKTVRIIQCDEPQAWYFECEGDEYEVIRETWDSYYVDDSRYILKDDAVVIE